MQSEKENVNIDDSALVRRCKQGDSQAMEGLIIRYQNRIYNVILKICANVDDAAELSQETFVKAIENIDKFKGKSSFYTWLFRIAVNLTLNYCKRKVKLVFRSIDTAETQLDAQYRPLLKDYLADTSSIDPGQIAQDKEIYELLIKALMSLDDDQRTVVVLRDIEGMDYAQIADVLDLNLGTVKSRLFRARNNLREILLEVVLQ